MTHVKKGSRLVLGGFFIFMNQEQFIKRYRALIMIGQIIQVSCEYQLKTSVLNLEKAAKQITPSKLLFSDVHWLKEPLSENDAWKQYKLLQL